ncbi:MAG: two-component sensor histidine kinase, partial [Pedobacter sp.]
ASQLEGGGYRFAKDELDFSDLVMDSISDFQRRFPDRTIHSQVQPEVELQGDPLLLQMLVNNLVENALKYSPADKSITITLEGMNKEILLQVVDEGIGVPDNEKKKIFNRFYRIGNEATRKTPGTGLGLYLCSKIARDHNADISVTNHNPQGSNFAVKFHT